MRHLGTARAGAYYSIAPFFGALLAVTLGDPLTWQAVMDETAPRQPPLDTPVLPTRAAAQEAAPRPVGPPRAHDSGVRYGWRTDGSAVESDDARPFRSPVER